MKDINVNEIAENLLRVISRLLKISKTQTKNEELLSLTERSALASIYQYTEILPSELAAMEKVTAQSMSQNINKLLKHGFIKKTPSRTDKRKVIITITTSGKNIVEKRRLEKQEWLAQAILEKTTQKEKELLVNAIKVLVKLAD
jgi:DNA-binding MarR family transcriptional regulator